MSSQRFWPVILSGGAGTRLWPLSRAEVPKQLLPLTEERTMLQATVARVGDAERFHPPVIVANARHLEAIEAQLAAVGAAPHRVILEPTGRNTAPAIALAAHLLVREDPQAAMLVMPSDHVVGDVAAFHRGAAAAAPAVEEGWLVTFGIRATRPETGYGYIKLGEPLGPAVRRVERFVEKPEFATARAYVEDGGYAWNGGIFLLRADRYLDELELHAPAILEATREAAERAEETGTVVRPEERAFAASPADSIDYAVMERAARVAVVPVEMAWSDIGSWDALKDHVAADEHGNAMSGDVVETGSRNCLLRSEGPLIAAVDLEDIVVVATHDAVLVARRGAAQDVKRIVDQLKAAGRSELL